jgi:hypothetical protein
MIQLSFYKQTPFIATDDIAKLLPSTRHRATILKPATIVPVRTADFLRHAAYASDIHRPSLNA